MKHTLNNLDNTFTRIIGICSGIIGMILLAVPGSCWAGLPPGLPCASWPTNITEVTLKNAGLISIPDLDESKTKAIPISIEKIGKDLYRQVFDITLYAKSGQEFRVITVNSASSVECSMSDVAVYLVSKKFGTADR